MAVQQRRKTRSKRDMRRAQDNIQQPTISFDSETGDKHRRHHVTPEGTYRGRQVVNITPDVDEDDE